jgi:hypothetical protein
MQIHGCRGAQRHCGIFHRTRAVTRTLTGGAAAAAVTLVPYAGGIRHAPIQG